MCRLPPARIPPGVCFPHLLPKQSTRQEAVSRLGQTQQSALGRTNLLSHRHPHRLLALPCAASFPLLPTTASLPAVGGLYTPAWAKPFKAQLPASQLPAAQHRADCYNQGTAAALEPCVHGITSAGARAQQARFPPGRGMGPCVCLTSFRPSKDFSFAWDM